LTSVDWSSLDFPKLNHRRVLSVLYLLSIESDEIAFIYMHML